MRSLIIFKILLLFLLIVVLTAPAHAVDTFATSIRSIDSEIYSDETAAFDLEITNLNDEERDYIISFPDSVNWDARTDPRAGYITIVPAGEKKKVKLLITPLRARPGQHNVLVYIKSRHDGSKKTRTIVLDVYDANDPRREYTPSIITSVIMDKKIDPKDRVVIKVKLKNLIPRELKGVSLKIASQNTNIISDSAIIDLKPSDEVNNVFFADLDQFQKPLTDTLKVSVSYFDKIYNRTFAWESDPVKFEILSYSTIAMTESEDKSFLRKENKYHLTNLGNIDKEHVFRMEISAIEDLFTGFTPKGSAILREDGKRLRVWILKINPNETIDIKAVSNYRIVFYLVIIIIIVIVSYHILRSPILVKKTAVSLKKNQGGVSDIKIRVYVRNRSGKPYEDIRIIDKIPHIAEVGEEFHIGTIKPSEIIKRSRAATIIKWNLSHLEPFEERLITYIVKSKLMIIGSLKIPSCVVRYKATNGKIKSVYSNIVFLK